MLSPHAALGNLERYRYDGVVSWPESDRQSAEHDAKPFPDGDATQGQDPPFLSSRSNAHDGDWLWQISFVLK